MPRDATETRQRIVATTVTLLRRGGLASAGLAEVVNDARAPRGSVYHHFPAGKSQMVAEALEAYRIAVAAQIASGLAGAGDLRRRTRRLFGLVSQRMAASDFAESCAVGAVVLDLAAEDLDLRGQCDAILRHWAQVAADHLLEIEPSRRLAAGRLLVTLLEGAQLAARAARSPRPLEEAAAAFWQVAPTVEAGVRAGRRSTRPAPTTPPPP